jgi:hypothetical protein
MPATPSTSKHIYLYSMYEKQGEMQVRFSWIQSYRLQDQRSYGMLLFSTDYPAQVSVSYFSCKAALLNLASPWLGPCLSAKRPLIEPCSCEGLLPLPQSHMSTFYIWKKTCNLWLFGLLCLTWGSPVPSIYLQTTFSSHWYFLSKWYGQKVRTTILDCEQVSCSCLSFFHISFYGVH